MYLLYMADRYSQRPRLACAVELSKPPPRECSTRRPVQQLWLCSHTHTTVRWLFVFALSHRAQRSNVPDRRQQKIKLYKRTKNNTSPNNRLLCVAWRVRWWILRLDDLFTRCCRLVLFVLRSRWLDIIVLVARPRDPAHSYYKYQHLFINAVWFRWNQLRHTQWCVVEWLYVRFLIR